MIESRPAYFDHFRCIAQHCPDSCCKEWEVQVDQEAAQRYLALPGDLGQRLRQVLRSEDGQWLMTIEQGRCPMWRADGLCRIQAELDHDALCQVCREFPRLTHDYGDFVERGLELSCPAAAKWILGDRSGKILTRELPGGEAPSYDGEAMEVLLRTREYARELLADHSRPVEESLALLLLYGCQAQGELDGDEELEFDCSAALESAREFGKTGTPDAMLAFFRELEILTPEWKLRLDSPVPGPWQEAHRALARYFVDRYWLQAVSDYDLYCRVKLAVILCLLVRTLGGDPVSTAQLCSKEIENNLDNVEAILDGAYAHPAFTDDKLLGMLLKK